MADCLCSKTASQKGDHQRHAVITPWLTNGMQFTWTFPWLFFLKWIMWVLQLILGFWTANSNAIFHLFQVSYLHYLPCCPVETEFPCCSGVMWKDGFGNLLSWELHGRRMKSMAGESSCVPCDAIGWCRLSQFKQMPKEYSLLHSQKELQRDRNVSVKFGFWPGCEG